MPDYGYGENQINNWYIAGRTPSNEMYVPADFDISKKLGYDPISKDTPEAMVDGTLYTVEGGILKAIDLSTFKPKWQYTSSGPYGSIDGFAVRDNLIFAATPRILRVIENMGSSYRVLWEAQSDTGFNHLTFDDNNVYYVNCILETSTAPESCQANARNALTGQLLWSHPSDTTTGMLLAGGNRVFMGGNRRAGTDIKVAAVNSSTGNLDWETTVDSSGLLYSAVYSDNIVYLPVSRNDGSSAIFALDASTGNILWQYINSGRFHTTMSLEALSVNQAIVFFLDSNDNMIALDKKTGALKWKKPYGDPIREAIQRNTVGRPILTATQIVLDKNSKIKVFQAATGTLLKEYLPYQLVPNGKAPFILLMLNADRMVVAGYYPFGAFYSISPNALPKTSYTIQAGDTLYKISQRYNTTVDYLVLLNNMDVNAPIYIGQVITVPQADTSYVNYIVKTGDTLYKIALAHNSTINEIATLNNITNLNNIYPGLSLKIPVHIIHTVAPGESLYVIASKYNVTVQDIIQKNGITNPNLLYVGQKLLIK